MELGQDVDSRYNFNFADGENKNKVSAVDRVGFHAVSVDV